MKPDESTSGEWSEASHSILSLEQQGEVEAALHGLRGALIRGLPLDADVAHLLGRLYQRLDRLQSSRRAYQLVIALDPARPRTLNNLALLELSQLDAAAADHWLQAGLALAGLEPDDLELLLATASDLRLFQQQPEAALCFAERHVALRRSSTSLSNYATCLVRTGRLHDAVAVQREAVEHQLMNFAPQLIGRPLETLFGVACGSIQDSINLQTQLFNLAVFRLCVQPDDAGALKLLLTSLARESLFWRDPCFAARLWRGEPTTALAVWDDQGYGDALQNLSFLNRLASRVPRLELWLRPSLHSLVQRRAGLPANVSLKTMTSKACPWQSASHHLPLFFLPFILDCWPTASQPVHQPWLRWCRQASLLSRPRIGLVWRAGSHPDPQSERGARVRDVPFATFWAHAQHWRQVHGAELVSLQLDARSQAQSAVCIAEGRLTHQLSGDDWLSTAECLDLLDLVVTVDTSVAHLAGAMHVPTVLLLGSPCDWRWGQTSLRTPLYASLHLARCSTPGDWASAMPVADSLVKQLLASRN